MVFSGTRGGGSSKRRERKGSRLRRQETDTEAEDETGILFMGDEDDGYEEPAFSSSQTPPSIAAPVDEDAADRDRKSGTAEVMHDGASSDTEEDEGVFPLRSETTQPVSSSSSSSDSGDDYEEVEERGEASAEAEDSDEGDDPVVREIDVYLRRLDVSGSASVYVLQYPLRPLYRPYGDQGQLLEVAYREKQRTLHFTYGLNTRGDNFDPNHPMNLEAGKNASSSFPGAGGTSSSFSSPSTRHNLSGEQEGERDAMPRHVLKSQRAAAGDCSYAVGILKQDKLFITPVDHVLQFRPDFSQVDRLAQSQQASRAAPHASGLKAASGSGLPAAGVGGGTDSGAESKGSGRGETEDERSDEKTRGAGSGVSKGGDEAGKGKLGGLVGGNGPGISAGGGTMSAGQGRSRMSHSKQRDVEESEEWLPVETFYDAETPEAFDIIRTLCSTLGAPDEELETSKKNEPEDLLADLSESKDTEDAEPAVAKLPPKPVAEDILFVADTQRYLRRLCGNGSASGGSESGGGVFGLQSAAAATHQAAGPLGYGALAKLSADQQVFTILRHRHVESFATIRRLLTVAMTETELLRVLLQYGILVLGNWAIKSLYVYDDMYDISCRDLLLALLIRNGGGALAGGGTGGQAGGIGGAGAASTAAGGLPKEAFRSATRLPMDKVNQMMQEVAVCSCSAWHLKLPPDTAFAAAHPSIQKHFDQWWRQRLQQVVKEIHQRRDAAFNANYGNNQQKAAGSAGGTSSENGSAGGGAPVSPALLQLAGRVCASALSSQGAMTLSELRSMIDKKNGDFASISDRDLERVLQTVAIQVGTVWLSPKVGNAQIDVFRDALITMFRKQTQPQSKAQIIQELGQTLKRRVDLPDFTLRKLLRELAVNEGGLWSFKGRVAEPEEEISDVPETFS